MTTEPRVIPHPLHDWQAEQQRLDMIPNLRRDAEEAIDRLIELNAIGTVIEIVEETWAKLK